MSGEFCLAELRCHCRRYDRRAVAVADVVLHNENGAHSALLAPNNRAQIRIIKIASLDHSIHTAIFDRNVLFIHLLYAKSGLRSDFFCFAT